MALWSRRRAGHRLIVSSNPTSARLWRRRGARACGPGCRFQTASSPKLMVECIIPEFFERGVPRSLHHILHAYCICTAGLARTRRAQQ